MNFWEKESERKNSDGEMHMYERWRRWRLPRPVRKVGTFRVCDMCGYMFRALGDVEICKYCYRQLNRHEINREKRF